MILRRLGNKKKIAKKIQAYLHNQINKYRNE